MIRILNFSLLTALLLAPLAAFAATPQKPNIVFILTDDLGWTDLGCQGSTFYETPNIDRLATQGMRFTDNYAACCVCSPSRAGILTGQYPARLHLTDWLVGGPPPNMKFNIPDWTTHLSLEAPNLAKSLKVAGYVTASIGKWHLGTKPYWPEKQGFDVTVAGCEKGQPPSYFAPYKIPTLPEGPKGEFLSDRLTDEAINFIEQNKDKPFFLYLPHYAVHRPTMAKPGVIAKYKDKAKADPKNPHHNPVYAGLIESVDDSVGRLLAKLDELKLADNTIVIFTSDNGGLTNDTSNAPLRKGKGWSYEGGVRVPLIVKWPGVTNPGSVCNAPVIGVDFYPTLLALAGVTPPPGPVDGESIEPLLRGAGTMKREAIFWHFPHYRGGGTTPYSAIREGDWKLIEFLEDMSVELYNLKEDIGETKDLAATMPDKVNALRKKLHDWRNQVGAQMITPNPKYDPNYKEDPSKPHAKDPHDVPGES
jgi:arylsulfatase A